MASPNEAPEDAITADEIAGMATPPKRPHSPSEKSISKISKAPRNAFTELLSPTKSKPSTKAPRKETTHTRRPPPNGTDAPTAASNIQFGRGALAQYVLSPTSFPSSRVIHHDDNFVVIRDLYPKASVHLLILPRDRIRSEQHPFEALDGTDGEFLRLVRAETDRVKALAASELRRRFARDSAAEKPRVEAMDAGVAPDELPPGRDWSADILTGVHAHPSMHHLHIHVISRDRRSECVKHTKHYNSFATPFFVPLEDFPLAEDDRRRHPGREGYLKRGLVCWRCGREFESRFKKLKEHLEEEFEGWKGE